MFVAISARLLLKKFIESENVPNGVISSLILFRFHDGWIIDHWPSVFLPLCAMTYGGIILRMKLKSKFVKLWT